MRNYRKSEALSQRFNELYPGGHSNFRAKMNAGSTKLFVNRAEGSHVWDVDGNEYIEYNGAMGPILLGHRNREWVEAIKEYMDKEATIYGTNLLYGERDIELAELLCKHIPCAEEVKLCVTGSEAVQLAFRIARAYTGKPLILRFENGYNGWIDNVMNSSADYDALRKGELPHPGPTPEDGVMYSEGLSPWADLESIIIPYNDFDILEETFEKYHDQIAIAHFEPMITDFFCIYPKPGFLEKVRELCDKYNVVLSFDEIITGFRASLGGMQQILGVTPDITTIGKAMSGGIPMSAVVGKKKIMDVFRKKAVIGAGTFNGYGLGVCACTAAIKIYERNNGEIYRKIAEVQERLITGMIDITKKYGVDMAVSEAAGVFFTVFGSKHGRCHPTDLSILEGYDNEFFNCFRKHLMDEGVTVMILCRWYVSAAHTMEDAEKTLAAFERALVKTINER